VETMLELACNYLNVGNGPKIEILTMPAMQLSTVNEEVEKLFVLQRQAMTKERWRISKSKFGEKTEVLIGQGGKDAVSRIIAPLVPRQMSMAPTVCSEIEYMALKSCGIC
jgi:hypothetical protein